jgi:glycosyltransferase involved in cell wall biosynthesis
MMKAVHILHSIEFSGAEIMLYQASDIFRENNIETTLLACEKKPGQFEQPMREKGYKVDSVGADGKLNTLVNFYNYFKKNKFDIVHIHTEDMYLWRVIALKLTGHHNIVRSFHKCWTFKGSLRAKRILHRRLASILGVKNHAIGAAVEANERDTFLNKTFIINNWIQLKPEILDRKVDIRRLKRQELGIDPDSFVIISIGGCSHIKNHEFILNLIEPLSNKGLQVTYLHVGAGKDEEAEKISSKTLGLDSKVIFTGNRKDIPELLICADIYLMPSLFEGLSIALLEAMYYNGLVVVNDAPGLTNMIDKYRTGYIIDVKEKDHYLDLIGQISNGQIDVSQMKSNAKAFVEENFSMEVNVRKLIAFYKQNTQLGQKENKDEKIPVAESGLSKLTSGA